MKRAPRRLLHAVLLLFGVSLFSFALLALAPGDFFDEMRLDPRITPEAVNALKARYGLDRPFPVRYARWLASVARGDLGFSFAYNEPAAPLLVARARNTLILTGLALVLCWSLAVPLGVWSAARRGGWADHAGEATGSVLLAIPELLMSLLLLFFAVRTGLFPAGGIASLDHSGLNSWGKAADLAWHLFLPVTALVLGTLPMVARHVRAGVADALDSRFVLAARSLGLSRRRILFRYALPAAANPLISLFGVSAGSLLSASLVVEVMMGWPGLGPLLFEAILARDLYLVVGSVMFSTLFLIAGQLVADLLLYAADPRIRMEEA